MIAMSARIIEVARMQLDVDLFQFIILLYFDPSSVGRLRGGGSLGSSPKR